MSEMSELIAVRCHACKVGMKIKPEYAGKLRKCPKCGAIFIVPHKDGLTIEPPPEVLEKVRQQMAVQTSAPKPEVPATPSTRIVIPEEETIQPVEHPKRLNPQFRYVILSSERMIAYWQMSTGWQVSDGARLTSAKRNSELLPKQGDFRFIEMRLGEVDGEFRVTKLRIFQLARQYSVSKIAGDENDVLSTIISTAGLTRSQKGALLQGLKAHFMRGVWADSPTIYEYLFNEDFHSCEV